MMNAHIQSPSKVGRSVIRVLFKPLYTLLALGVALLVLGILVWLFNIQTLTYVLSASFLPAGKKLNYFLSGYANSFGYFFKDPVTSTRVIFSLLAGINISLIWFITRHHKDTSSLRKGTGGLAVALISTGCIACGTSILSPILASFGAAVSASSSQLVGVIGNIFGIMLMTFSIYGLGKRIAQEEITKGGNYATI